VECLPDSTDNGIAVSMDGKGALWDNVFVERLWRSVKYEDRRRIWVMSPPRGPYSPLTLNNCHAGPNC
jgi:transposase InsO family protein